MTLSRILIIDDEPGFTRLLKWLLVTRLKKYEVCEVNDPLQALESARKFKPDLILMDTIMPAIDGFALTEQFRAETEFGKVPIIIMESFGWPRQTIHSFLTMNGYPYLTKPVSQEFLVACIEHYLSQA